MGKSKTNNKLSDWLPGLIIVSLMGIAGGVYLLNFYIPEISSIEDLLMLLVLPYLIPIFTLVLMLFVWYAFIKTYIFKIEPKESKKSPLSLILLVMFFMLFPYFIVEIMVERHFDVVLFLMISLIILLMLYGYVLSLKGTKRKRMKKAELFLEFALDHFEYFAAGVFYFALTFAGCFLVIMGLSAQHPSEKIVTAAFGGLILVCVGVNAYLQYRRRK